MKNLLKVTILSLIISGCASNQIDRDQSKKHFVRYGETIIFIAWRYGIDHQDLISWNNLTNEGLIYPGQILGLEPPQNFTRVNRKKESEEKPAVKTIQKFHSSYKLFILLKLSTVNPGTYSKKRLANSEYSTPGRFHQRTFPI